MSTTVQAASVLADKTAQPGIDSKIRAAIGHKKSFMPTQLAIETVRACNAKCTMCPSETMKRPRGIMSREVHETILSKISRWGAPVSLITHAGLGEPLLDKMLEDRIRREKEVFPNAQVIVYTNGSLLDEARALKLIASGVDVVSFSINGFRKETYEAVMQLPRDNTYYNVEAFCRLKQRTGSNVGICVSLVKTDLCGQQEIEEYSQYWQARHVTVVTPPWISWGNLLAHSVRKPQHPCLYIWKTMMIDNDGTVKLCCEDYDSQYPLGNIMTQEPSEIFNSPNIQRLRSNQLNGDFSWLPMCRNCTETFEPAADFWKSSPSLFADTARQTPAAPQIQAQQRIIDAPPAKTAAPRQAQPALETFLAWLEMLNPEQYKLALGHMLAKGLDLNHFDFPQGIWPPPTPARVYIEQFLVQYKDSVRGRCVEFAPAVYKELFAGQGQITTYDVWNLSPGKGVTVAADLQNAAGVPDNTFDTIICTHVLSAIPDVRRAAKELHRVLKPGGLILCTVPAVLQCYAPDPKDYWRFTQDSIGDLFGDFSRSEIHVFGNPATVSGSPFYLMSYHFPAGFMEKHSQQCPSIIAAAAWK
jgi:radical SAM protein with 4Fe4S-binding SPASM domain